MPASVMAIPINILWKVRISLPRKLALSGIFSLVIITMAFAILRVSVISAEADQSELSWLQTWSFIEQSVGQFSPFQFRCLAMVI